MKRTALVLVLLLTFVFPGAAHAQEGIIYGDSIPAGVVVNHDVLLIGGDVRIDGVVNGNAFILGNQVSSTEVNGSSSWPKMPPWRSHRRGLRRGPHSDLPKRPPSTATFTP
jgi:hypothetical protein